MKAFLVGAIALFVLADSTAIAAPMKFSIIDTIDEKVLRITFDGGQVRIFAEGDIEQDSAEKLQAFVKARGIDYARLHFNSPGGSLGGGLKLGTLIRERGFDTTVEAKGWEYGQPPAAICASACAYAFAGGVNRFYSENSGRLGLHQFSLPNGNLGDVGEAQNTSGLLAAYLEKMGAKPLAFVAASRTDSSQMLWLTSDQAVEVGLANNGIQPPTAEIKLANGTPYLRLEQQQHNVTARVILICKDNQYSVFGGIVTDQDGAKDMSAWQDRAYLEFDGDQKYAQSGPKSSRTNDSVLWITREISKEDARRLIRTKTLGMWVENGGPMRRGAMIELSPVSEKIKYYLDNCTG